MREKVVILEVLHFLGETMEMESTKKRTVPEMEVEGNLEDESNDETSSRRSTSPEPARKKKKIDPVRHKRPTLSPTLQ